MKGWKGIGRIEESSAAPFQREETAELFKWDSSECESDSAEHPGNISSNDFFHMTGVLFMYGLCVLYAMVFSQDKHFHCHPDEIP